MILLEKNVSPTFCYGGHETCTDQKKGGILLNINSYFTCLTARKILGIPYSLKREKKQKDKRLEIN